MALSVQCCGDKYQGTKAKAFLRQETSRTDGGYDWDQGRRGVGRRLMVRNTKLTYLRPSHPCRIAAITSNRPFRSFIPAIGRYERSERMFGDVLSSLDAHVTARMAESEYLFKFGCVESGDIEVAWLNTGRRGTRWSK
ncbi:hypothetical protein BC629DRAFT_1444978 [Irpex lacteus]|nr:hypothetical protein BC629DRAFT_1444978 [Irpex lacteus]